jgi:hypothetical protein
MKRILILAVLLAGCYKHPESIQQVNAEFNVETLFTKDGCTVYRFADGGTQRYFTNCRGTVAWHEGCGKNCTRDVAVSGGAQ